MRSVPDPFPEPPSKNEMTMRSCLTAVGLLLVMFIVIIGAIVGTILAIRWSLGLHECV